MPHLTERGAVSGGSVQRPLSNHEVSRGETKAYTLKIDDELVASDLAVDVGNTGGPVLDSPQMTVAAPVV